PVRNLSHGDFTGFVCSYLEVGITVNTRAVFSVNVSQNGSIRKLPFKAFVPCVSEYTVKGRDQALNEKSTSFALEQQKKILESKWDILQQDRVASSNMDRPCTSYINSLR
ncbi:hypothetical protein U0070_019155, partial [Myodes glareolus]